MSEDDEETKLHLRQGFGGQGMGRFGERESERWGDWEKERGEKKTMIVKKITNPNNQIAQSSFPSW